MCHYIYIGSDYPMIGINTDYIELYTLKEIHWAVILCDRIVTHRLEKYRGLTFIGLRMSLFVALCQSPIKTAKVFSMQGVQNRRGSN